MASNMIIIAAMDKNNLIGKNNDLPWRLPADLEFVKEVTQNNTIVMGRKNYESIGRPLPNRRNIILTRNKNYTAPGCEVFHTINGVIEATMDEDNVYIFGGSDIYKLFMPYVYMMVLTKIDHEFEGDVYFPEVNWDEWVEVCYKRGVSDEKNIYKYATHFYGREGYLDQC